jgi:hypothetical protein
MHRSRTRLTLKGSALLAGAVAPIAASVAQDSTEVTVIDIEQIAVTGTRVPDRSAIATAVPWTW